MDKNVEWKKLIEEIMSCSKCPLHRSRRNPVPGEGRVDADIMFIGEAPGVREDETGRPFVGAAGKLLTELIESIGLKRGDVYITNIVKCRPPGNRDPRDEEIDTCLPYLLRQIRLIEPKVIVALGRHAGRVLYSLAGLRWANMSVLHGRVYDVVVEGVRVKLVATYHPAAALYNPRLRDSLVGDFKNSILKAIRESRESVSRKQTTLVDFFK